MATNFYASVLSNEQAKGTSQLSPIKGKEEDMGVNNAGGFSFVLDYWYYLDRFLILGSDTSSYYVTAQKLTKDAAKCVLECIDLDPIKTVNRIVSISVDGRAPKNDPAIFALALCAISTNAAASAAAYSALTKVCRTGTHLFQFVDTVNSLGKWNASAKRGIAEWYKLRNENNLAHQLLKYQSRNGWSHRDVLRLSHVKPESISQSRLFEYVVKGGKDVSVSDLPSLVVAYEEMKNDPTEATALKVIRDNPQITWEMLPTNLHNNVNVMISLIPSMGMTALIRKLGQLTSIGAIKPLTTVENMVVEKIFDVSSLKKERVHPITILNALNQYKKGAGERGKLTWKPVQKVVDALNDAFYESFQFIPSTDCNNYIAVDCSGSMFGAKVSGAPSLSAAEVSAVMALAVAKRESNYYIAGFNHTMQELKISPNMRIDTVLATMKRFPWGGTDCAQPILHAIKNGMSSVDKFIMFTDSETWCGVIHAVEAINRYRSLHVENCKMIVCGTSTTSFSIADPKDHLMLDVVGFDSAVPQLIQSF